MLSDISNTTPEQSLNLLSREVQYTSLVYPHDVHQLLTLYVHLQCKVHVFFVITCFCNDLLTILSLLGKIDSS